MLPSHRSMRAMKSSFVLVLGLCAAAVPFAHGGSKRAEYRFRQIAGGFSSPTYVAQPKGERGRLYVVEQEGRIVTLANGKRSTFLDIRSRVESGGEQGLLSVAFHPRYARNHRFYVYYTVRGSGDIEIDSFRSRRGRGVLASRRRLLRVAHHVNSNHNGG